MKRITAFPTYKYVLKLLNDPTVLKVVEGWYIDFDFLATQITKFLESMGLYEVNPVRHKTIVLRTIHSQLLHNVEIQNKLHEIRKAQEENNQRKRTLG